MGGHAAGEVALHLAVDTIESFVNETRDADVNRTWPFPYDHALSLDGNRLKAACRLANRRLAAAIESDESRRGMATTAVALLLSNGAPVVAHVGDSRCYLWRGDELTQITEDHSWVSEQVRAGVLTDTNARQHPWRNVVTRALAGGDDPQVDVTEVVVRPGDRLLLCTDGLSGVVSADELTSIPRGQAALDRTCQSLIDAANAAGGPDNITVVMVEMQPSHGHDPARKERA
jgi:protein phosphatase